MKVTIIKNKGEKEIKNQTGGKTVGLVEDIR